MTAPPAAGSADAVDRAVGRVPPGIRRALGDALLGARRATARWRPLPDTLIVGTMRGGTSSLFRWLAAHPRVSPSLRKEVDYFTRHFHRGPGWYAAHFALGGGGADRRRLEASPDYLLDPRAADRAAGLLPDARAIALLRNPVDRAYSHWQVLHRLGHETLSFEDALAAEEERLAPGWAALAADPERPLSRALIDGSYRTRGRYLEQLERWLARYPAERVLVLASEDLYARPAAVWAEILAFLDLPAWSPARFAAYSHDRKGPVAYGPMRADTRAALAAEFAPGNAALEARLGRRFGWSDSSDGGGSAA